MPTERNSQLRIVQRRMAFNQPVSSFPESSAAIANANGTAMLM